jgi:hypothetical protein
MKPEIFPVRQARNLSKFQPLTSASLQKRILDKLRN